MRNRNELGRLNDALNKLVILNKKIKDALFTQTQLSFNSIKSIVSAMVSNQKQDNKIDFDNNTELHKIAKEFEFYEMDCRINEELTKKEKH